MKYIIALALIATVASAVVIRPSQVVSEEISQIVDAINHPATDAATAVLLEQMLLDMLGASHPISVGPAIIDEHPITTLPALVDSPISTLPALVDFPLTADGQLIVEGSPAVVPPVVITPEVPAAQSAPLVQIILNVNAAAGLNPVVIDTPVTANPVLVDESPVVADPMPRPTPVAVDPVVVVDQPPVIIPGPIVLPPAPGPVVIIPEPIIVAEPDFQVAVPLPATIN